MKFSSTLMVLLLALMMVDFSTSWCCVKPRRRYPRRPRRCPWGGWRHYKRPRWCGRHYHNDVDVKKYTNAFKGNAIHSQINMNNGGCNNKQTNVKIKKIWGGY